jgi:ABC-type transport system involved in multi-copper enzyme maturation permease subunit
MTEASMPRTVAPATGLRLWLRVALESARQTLLLQARSRMTQLLLLLGGMFTLGLWFVPPEATERLTGEELYAIVATQLLGQFFLPAAVTWFGIQALASERDDRTILWLFARPAPRTALLTGKWLASWLFGAAWIVLALVVLHLGLALPGHEWRRGLAPDPSMALAFAVVFALASASYSALGLLFASVFKRPVLTGLLFVAGWEVIASNLPPEAVGVRALTVADPARRAISMFVTDDPGVQKHLFPNDALVGLDPGAPWWDFLRFLVVVLGAALIVFSQREYDLRPKE